VLVEIKVRVFVLGGCCWLRVSVVGEGKGNVVGALSRRISPRLVGVLLQLLTSVSGRFENLVFVVRGGSREGILFVARVPGRQSDREGVTRFGTRCDTWGCGT